MQSVTSWLPTLREALSGLGVAIIAASGWLTFFLNRRKVPSEIHKTEAEAGFFEAQTEAEQVQARTNAADAVLKMLDRVDALRRERDDALEAAAEVPVLTSQRRLIETQLDRAKADVTYWKNESEIRGIMVGALLLLLVQTSTKPSQPE